MSSQAHAVEGEIVNEAIVAQPQVHLGSIAVRNPNDLVAKATEMANMLANIINKQNLYKTISGRKYVIVDGWTTLGAMMGIVPVEEYCQPLPDGSGFEAKVKLIRASDGGTVGAASAECTRTESNWSDRDSYAIRSMSITRATGKAYRLSFSWIMKLAGFEATPAEEMDGGQQDEPTPVPEKPKTIPAETGKSILLKELGNGSVSLCGDGLAAILVALGEEGKQKLEMTWQGSPTGWVMPPKSSFAIEDACKALGVGFSYIATPERAAAPPPPASVSTAPSLGHGKITNTEQARGKKGEYMRVWQSGNKMQAFDNPQMRLKDGSTIALFTLLKTAKGQEAIFQVNKSGNYLNIVGVSRLGRLAWDVTGAPV
jgi:hypothetical protein